MNIRVTDGKLCVEFPFDDIDEIIGHHNKCVEQDPKVHITDKEAFAQYLARFLMKTDQPDFDIYTPFRQAVNKVIYDAAYMGAGIKAEKPED
jgi:hypothetical protein